MRFQPKMIEPLKVNLIGIAIYSDSYELGKIEEVKDYIEVANYLIFIIVKK